MAFTINEGKEAAQARRPVILADFRFPDGAHLCVATIACAFGEDTYAAAVSEQEIDRLAWLSEQGIDRVASASLTLIDQDGALWAAWERGAGRGFKGATLTLRFALYDAALSEWSTDYFVPFLGLCDQPGYKQGEITISAASRLNLTKCFLPSVPIQVRCPWINPATEEQRAQADDPESWFHACGETRDLATAPPCQNTRQTCTQPARYGGSTWKPEKSGTGREYIAGRISWDNPDTSGKYKEFWPQWLGGTAWIEGVPLNPWADGNYCRTEVAVGCGEIAIDKVILNGVELDYVPSMTGDYRWHYVNQGARDGAANGDVGYTEGDPYGGLTVIQVLAPHKTFAPGSVPTVRILGHPKHIRSYRSIASASASGGEITLTFEGPNEDCAVLAPSTVTVVGCSMEEANGTFELSNFTFGPPGTVTLRGTAATGSGTGGFLYYAESGIIVSPNSCGGALTPWVLLEALRWSRFAYSDFDAHSWSTAARICAVPITYTTGDGESATQTRFSNAIALKERRAVADLVRGLRQSICALLVPGPDGKLKLQVEGPLGEQQPEPVDGSNYDTPIAGTLRDGTAADGYAAYRFDEANSWDLKRTAQAISAMPNRVQFAFRDPANDYAVSQFSMAEGDDTARTDQETGGGLQVEPEGIASYNHAFRLAQLGLAKIHRGNPAGDTRGTEWWEFKTSFRGCRLTVGQIVLANDAQAGLVNAQVRLTGIQPSRNYETATLTGHIHKDAWYSDGGASIVDPERPVHLVTPPATGGAVTVSAADHPLERRAAPGKGYTQTPIYVAVGLPAGTDIVWIDLEIQKPYGAGWGYVGRYRASEPIIDWETPLTATLNWQVRITPIAASGTAYPTITSAQFEVTATAGVSGTIIDADITDSSYSVDASGVPKWSANVSCTVPASPYNIWANLYVRLVHDVTGAPYTGPGFWGAEQHVSAMLRSADSTDTIKTTPLQPGWDIQPLKNPDGTVNHFRTYRFYYRAECKDNAEGNVLQTCWDGNTATYKDATPDDQGSTLDGGKIDPKTFSFFGLYPQRVIGTVDGVNRFFTLDRNASPAISGRPSLILQRNQAVLDPFNDPTSGVPQYETWANVINFEDPPMVGDRLTAYYTPGTVATRKVGAGLGALVGAFTDGAGKVLKVVYIGNGPKTLAVPMFATKLQLGVSDDDYSDNSGSLTISVAGANVSVSGKANPWTFAGGINPDLPYGVVGATGPTIVAVTGPTVIVAYVSGTVRAGTSRPDCDAEGDPSLLGGSPSEYAEIVS